MYQATHKGLLHDRVLVMVRRIRRRWRARIAIRGIAVVFGTGLVAFLLSVYGLEVARFSASSVVWFRWILWLAVAGLTVSQVGGVVRDRDTLLAALARVQAEA